MGCVAPGLLRNACSVSVLFECCRALMIVGGGWEIGFFSNKRLPAFWLLFGCAEKRGLLREGLR